MNAKLASLPTAVRRRPAVQRHTVPIATQRRLAKAGLAASLGVLVWSALGGRRILRRYHTLAGVALLGFAAWHLTLYRGGRDGDRGPQRQSL